MTIHHRPSTIDLAALAWSLVYAVLGLYWSFGGRGFPYDPKPTTDILAPLIGRFGPRIVWIVVTTAGIPAAALATAMLRGLRSPALRPIFITAGALLAAALLLLMTGLNLLVLFGYIPYGIFGVITGGKAGKMILDAWIHWTVLHQVLCLAGGFLWLAATVSYARRSSAACPHCGRRDVPPAWQKPDRAARWTRIAVYIAMVAPVFYALTRYAWALGFPLGMTEEQLRRGQQSGVWISGLFLATFGLAGAVLMLGLFQRWGEVFPRWMPGLAGRRVPIALAVVPASLVSVLLVVGGVVIWCSLSRMPLSPGAILFAIGPTLLFPLWAAALAVATLGYYYRRRPPCTVCGAGAIHYPPSTTDRFANR